MAVTIKPVLMKWSQEAYDYLSYLSDRHLIPSKSKFTECLILAHKSNGFPPDVVQLSHDASSKTVWVASFWSLYTQNYLIQLFNEGRINDTHAFVNDLILLHKRDTFASFPLPNNQPM